MNIFRVLWIFVGVTAAAATNDLLSIGEVTIDPRARTLTFPAHVNLRSGAIEYLLVHETGKVHESLFKTHVAPQQIHLAALLLSEKNTNTPPAKPRLPPPAITITWKDPATGREKSAPAPQLILDKKNRRPLGQTKWAYRGSRLIDGVFLAQRDGSIIAVMEDRDALIDQDTPDASDDENWEPVTDSMPPLATPVHIQIRFERK